MALVEGLKPRQQQLPELGEPGCVGWHELFAADWKKAFAFYREIFGWQEAEAEIGPMEAYQLFAAGGMTIGGMFTKRPKVPIPFWLYYFNVGDIDEAAERVKAGGGEVSQGPIEMPGGSWIARCIDPQGAMFALQGTRSRDVIESAPATEIGWSTEWGGFSSKGRLVAKPAVRRRTPDHEALDRNQRRCGLKGSGFCQSTSFIIPTVRQRSWRTRPPRIAGPPDGRAQRQAGIKRPWRLLPWEAACPAFSTRRCNRRR